MVPKYNFLSSKEDGCCFFEVNILSAIEKHVLPDKRTILIPPLPIGVEIATILSSFIQKYYTQFIDFVNNFQKLNIGKNISIDFVFY